MQEPVGFAELQTGAFVVIYPIEQYLAKVKANQKVSKKTYAGATSKNPVSKPASVPVQPADTSSLNRSAQASPAPAKLQDTLVSRVYPMMELNAALTVEDLARKRNGTTSDVFCVAPEDALYATVMKEAVSCWTLQQAATTLWPSDAQCREWGRIAWDYAVSKMLPTTIGSDIKPPNVLRPRERHIEKVALTPPAEFRKVLLQKAAQYIAHHYHPIFIGEQDEVARRITSLCTEYHFLYKTFKWEENTVPPQGPFRSPALIAIMSEIYEEALEKHASLLEQMPFPMIAAVAAAMHVHLLQWCTGEAVQRQTIEEDFRLSYEEIHGNLAKYEEIRTTQFMAMQGDIVQEMR
ncbi:hypothetical protein CALVIDRAFT_361080 [Calocera viscosa TUFC12733]|uniref:DUF6532 domain-containing protein n=1 Tax=Calocera viscosa (strain TUFC12733) TaxID=1330018 RepID=A0A167H6A4_CALVF|nr:hypothetical protein CALVIDRAFT_361080 [Calocera viscosa TUFC12733]